MRALFITGLLATAGVGVYFLGLLGTTFLFFMLVVVGMVFKKI
jgi:hypothetical protein